MYDSQAMEREVQCARLSFWVVSRIFSAIILTCPWCRLFVALPYPIVDTSFLVTISLPHLGSGAKSTTRYALLEMNDVYRIASGKFFFLLVALSTDASFVAVVLLSLLLLLLFCCCIGLAFNLSTTIESCLPLHQPHLDPLCHELENIAFHGTIIATMEEVHSASEMEEVQPIPEREGGQPVTEGESV